MPQTNVIIKICAVFLFTLYNSNNIAYHITKELILMMSNSKNSRVFNFAILLKSSFSFIICK